MRNNLVYHGVRVSIGIVVCILISSSINMLIGYNIGSIMSNSTHQERMEVLDLFIITYLPIIVIDLILIVMILLDYYKNRKNNVLWKVMLLLLASLLFVVS